MYKIVVYVSGKADISRHTDCIPNLIITNMWLI